MNTQLFYFFYNFAHQSRFLDGLIVFCAEILPYFVVLAAGVFLLFHHEIFSERNPLRALFQKWREIFLVFFSGFFAWLFASIIKYLYHAPRPFDFLANVVPLFHESGYAFPSGHATFFMGLAFAVFFNHRKAGYFFIFFALLIGLARIASGVHSPADILGGFILGFTIAFLLKNV